MSMMQKCAEKTVDIAKKRVHRYYFIFSASLDNFCHRISAYFLSRNIDGRSFFPSMFYHFMRFLDSRTLTDNIKVFAVRTQWIQGICCKTLTDFTALRQCFVNSPQAVNEACLWERLRARPQTRQCGPPYPPNSGAPGVGPDFVFQPTMRNYCEAN